MKDFQTLPSGNFQHTLVVQKSRFLAFARRVENSVDAFNFIKSVALSDATHHCYAYVTTDGQKSNDNGEPAGTAGLPILQAIKNAQLTNVVVVVERYFGGIKLGTGGLARAYGQVANEILASVKSVWMRDCCVLQFSCSYEQQMAINKLIKKYGAQATSTYLDIVQWQVAIPVIKKTEFSSDLAEVLRTTPKIEVVEAHTWVEFCE